MHPRLSWAHRDLRVFAVELFSTVGQFFRFLVPSAVVGLLVSSGSFSVNGGAQFVKAATDLTAKSNFSAIQ